ncbi:MAG: Holliday junction resolvase RuvX [Actinomycetota bacterium]|nr:Holliday junction resolvase RuvX [Actinomycetota bacterium]
MGLDPGSRRIGVAVSDPLQLTAQPHSVIDLQSRQMDEALRSLADDLEVERVVVGLPVSLSGGEGAAAQAARGFARRVAEVTGLPVELCDERLTTLTAEAALVGGGVRRRRRRGLVDKVAAAVMLQSYLDRRR